MLASANGHLRVVRLLVEEGRAYINQVEQHSGTNALYKAAENGHNLIVEYLIEKGADVNVADRSGSTPIHVAVEVLVEKGLYC